MNPESGEKPLVLSGHIDTVYPVGAFPTPAVHREEGRIYGPGVIDCKGGVVAAVMAMDALQQCGFWKRPVKLIIQTDEETGSKTSSKQTIGFMLEKARDAVAFLNLEGVQYGTAVLSRKGILRYRFTVTGLSAHSAKCTEGANAICEAAYKIIELEKWKDTDRITCTCGVIQGGTAPNSVADSCVFQADIRFADQQQYQEVVHRCQQIAEESKVEGCTCCLEKVSERPAMPRTSQNEALFAKMNEICENCGLLVLAPRHAPGGSDAAYTTLYGIPTVDSIGVDGGKIHSPQEFAYIESLVDCAKRLAAMAMYM
jgi:glutamate carboxypeptidase